MVSIGRTDRYYISTYDGILTIFHFTIPIKTNVVHELNEK